MARSAAAATPDVEHRAFIVEIRLYSAGGAPFTDERIKVRFKAGKRFHAKS
jgi:hypothetical protein